LVVYLLEVWLFYYPVSYFTALLGIATRKAPQEVRFFTDIRVMQAAVQVAARVPKEYLPGGEELA
jgi:hypothetical protein